MRVHDLKPAPGATKAPKRVGRGVGGKGGKTAGRGTKGQKARNTVAIYFEGGQMRITQRTPKLKGFNNPFRVEYQPINVDTLVETGLTDVTPEALYERGLVGKGALVKVLGRGEVTAALRVSAHAFSASAAAAITAAGGTVERIPLPYRVRPAAQGNQFANR